jgi:hypothetical protein
MLFFKKFGVFMAVKIYVAFGGDYLPKFLRGALPPHFYLVMDRGYSLKSLVIT